MTAYHPCIKIITSYITPPFIGNAVFPMVIIIFLFTGCTPLRVYGSEVNLDGVSVWWYRRLAGYSAAYEVYIKSSLAILFIYCKFKVSLLICLRSSYQQVLSFI